jgi:putative phage-type endonuclease
MSKPEPTILDETDLNFSPEEVHALMQNADMEQGSEEWFEERLGKVTASRVVDVVARDRYGKPYKSYYDYIMQLALERVTGTQKRFSNKYMEHGTKYEAEAAAVYEEMHPEADIRECGFIEHPELAAGASPDRLIDEDGTMEIKAPNSDTLLKYMISMIAEDEEGYELVGMLGLKGNEWKYYYDQIQMQLYITGRKWCDFTVYDPDLPENIQLIVKRVDRDDEYINDLMVPRIAEFLEKVSKLENYLRNL